MLMQRYAYAMLPYAADALRASYAGTLSAAYACFCLLLCYVDAMREAHMMLSVMLRCLMRHVTIISPSPHHRYRYSMLLPICRYSDMLRC